MKVLCIHAHFDDYEFTMAGTFELLKRKLGDSLQARVIICTDGKSGHHFRTREETGKIRLQEQEASARVGGYQFEPLRLQNGEIPRSGCLLVTRELLAALWKSIRDFEPDYLFCPPVASDPLAGVHCDHISVAEAVRRVAYSINVPHAFTPEYPCDETVSRFCKVPVIIHCYDNYMRRSNPYDFAVDVEETFQKICEMSYCHQSQITEWLPWVHGSKGPAPKSMDEWIRTIRDRYQRQNNFLDIPSTRAIETFRITNWGSRPSYVQIIRDFPNILKEFSHLDQLEQRLAAC